MDEKTILHNVLEKLKGDEKLSGYVKSFEVGDAKSARKLFPFITVRNVETRIVPRTIGRGGIDDFIYAFEIVCGTRNLTPDIACAGEHGILQLCEDVVDVTWPSYFGGTFDMPARVMGVDTSFSADLGGTEWIGAVRMEGVRVVHRPE